MRRELQVQRGELDPVEEDIKIEYEHTEVREIRLVHIREEQPGQWRYSFINLE